LMECEEKDLISQWWKWHYEKNDIAWWRSGKQNTSHRVKTRVWKTTSAFWVIVDANKDMVERNRIILFYHFLPFFHQALLVVGYVDWLFFAKVSVHIAINAWEISGEWGSSIYSIKVCVRDL
jgi:hypothetical protein